MADIYIKSRMKNPTIINKPHPHKATSILDRDLDIKIPDFPTNLVKVKAAATSLNASWREVGPIPYSDGHENGTTGEWDS